MLLDLRLSVPVQLSTTKKSSKDIVKLLELVVLLSSICLSAILILGSRPSLFRSESIVVTPLFAVDEGCVGIRYFIEDDLSP